MQIALPLIPVPRHNMIRPSPHQNSSVALLRRSLRSSNSRGLSTVMISIPSVFPPPPLRPSRPPLPYLGGGGPRSSDSERLLASSSVSSLRPLIGAGGLRPRKTGDGGLASRALPRLLDTLGPRRITVSSWENRRVGGCWPPPTRPAPPPARYSSGD